MKFGELLVAAGVIRPEELEKALNYQKEHKGRIGSILVKLGYITENELNRFLEVQLGVTAVDLKSLKIPPGVIRLINPTLALRYRVIPLRVEGHTLVVAMADPKNLFALDDLKFAVGMNQIKVMVASDHSIKEALKFYYNIQFEDEDEIYPEVEPETSDLPRDGSTHPLDDRDIFREALEQISGQTDDETDKDIIEMEEDEALGILELKNDEFDAPIVRLISIILIEAVERGASDIHIEQHERELKVRFRMDGILHDMMHPPFKLHSAFVSRIKVMSNLDIAVRRVPQDGTICVRYKGRRIDFRVSTLPTVYGEKCVLRTLDKAKGLLGLDKLGLDAHRLSRLKSLIAQPQGMILVTGPTGSGKTSTLLSILDFIYSPTLNIITVEDPVEYRFSGINHVSINEKAGVTFSGALRSILRQDPDVIMIGEIRDRETAEIAIRAALTGHRVFSTLHTNSAIETLSRLIDMDIDPFMIGSSLIAVIGQRLVRKICSACSEEYQPDYQQFEPFGISQDEFNSAVFKKGKGCNRCMGCGYHGRLGIYEFLEIHSDIRNMIIARAPVSEIEQKAVESGFINLRRDGLNRVLSGKTTLEEVLRVTLQED